MKRIISSLFNSPEKIEKYANEFVFENKDEFKHLDFSMDSLHYIENIIDKKIELLTSDTEEIEKLTSYVYKTLIPKQQCGCVCVNETSNTTNFVYQSNCDTKEVIDIQNYITERIESKKQKFIESFVM